RSSDLRRPPHVRLRVRSHSGSAAVAARPRPFPAPPSPRRAPAPPSPASRPSPSSAPGPTSCYSEQNSATVASPSPVVTCETPLSLITFPRFGGPRHAYLRDSGTFAGRTGHDDPHVGHPFARRAGLEPHRRHGPRRGRPRHLPALVPIRHRDARQLRDDGAGRGVRARR